MGNQVNYQCYKQGKLEAGFQLSSDEESEEEDFQDAVESQGGNGHGKSGKQSML